MVSISPRVRHWIFDLDGTLTVEVHDGGWLWSDDALEEASAVVIFADGGAHHPLLEGDHLATISRLVDERGLGLGLMHYAVELPEGDGAERVEGRSRPRGTGERLGPDRPVSGCHGEDDEGRLATLDLVGGGRERAIEGGRVEAKRAGHRGPPAHGAGTPAR